MLKYNYTNALCRVSQAKREQPSVVSNAPPCYLYKLRAQTTLDFPPPQRHLWQQHHHQPINPIFAPFTALTNCATLVIHSPFNFITLPLRHHAVRTSYNYDNEPRTSGYDGMPYTYSPYANRRICSYELCSIDMPSVIVFLHFSLILC
jgi:hypothetical protein